MNELQTLFLGILQGLTEFLPISSSGHLELGNHFLRTPEGKNLTFTVTVHMATVLSTIVVFRKDIRELILAGINFRKNKETLYLLKLLLSLVPIAVAGFFFREEIESLYTGNLLLVGCCLLITATLLALTHFFKSECRVKEISWAHSFILGIAQVAAVLPGLSRSGLTIATGILLGNNRKEVARFSFLMVLLPVLGAGCLDMFNNNINSELKTGLLPLAVGFVAAFISGLLACTWMIRIVIKGKLIYFALYCLIIGLIAIFAA